MGLVRPSGGLVAHDGPHLARRQRVVDPREGGRVQHRVHLLPTPYILVAMSFNRVDVQGVVSPFVARSEADAALARELGANLAILETGIWFWGVGTFLFPTSKSRAVIPAGFESKWFTLATGGR